LSNNKQYSIEGTNSADGGLVTEEHLIDGEIILRNIQLMEEECF
jgi:hypothetical protein